MESHNIRLDQFILNHIPSFSREFIKKKIAKKEISIEGREAKTKPSTKVQKGDRIIMLTFKSTLEDEYWRGELIQFEEPKIIVENDDFVALSKPAFMSTHPTGKHLFHCATTYLQAKYQSNVHSIHRIDRETSGILILGKNVPFTQKMTEQFEEKNVRKAYFLIAHNTFQKDFNSFTAKERLAAEEVRLFVHCYPENSKEGKISETHFSFLYQDEAYIVGLAFPKTGRQHQIRAHAAFHGFPLVGDKIYHGGSEMFSRFKDNVAYEQDFDLMEIPRHALHALALKFPYHQQDQMIFDDIPGDLQKFLRMKKIEIDKTRLREMIQDNLA